MGLRKSFGVLSCALALVGGLCALPTAAWAAAVPGATYTGTASDGATITLTVAPNGANVTSLRVAGIIGTGNGGSCYGTISEAQDAWNGAPISANGFQYSAVTYSISGTFGGAQSASGTFNLNQPAGNNIDPCSTGAVSWTAMTSSSPSSVGTSGGEKPIPVRVGFRRIAQRSFVGSLKSSITACTARRTVYLWSGHKRLGSSRATKKGAFRFEIRKPWRRSRVHATVRSLTTKSGTCGAGSSSTIKG
jgi:hypothetical protein